VLLAWAAAAVGCSAPEAPAPEPRTLVEARQLVLDLFQQLDGFELERQREEGLAGRPAVRMEARWRHEGEQRRGILYVLDHPALFNVIHYTAPSEGGLFDAGLPVFQGMLRELRVIQQSGPLTVTEEGEQKIMRSPELQLEIRYPADWVYSLDEVNRAMVFSGPKDKQTWLSTVSFSVVHKQPGRPAP
ncbi:MAG TPA: hypothetical protein P5076_13195, partial [Myxococcota bacterium]|nr:hypothetical protein [Myxococcota bacterium]